ncbi:hypothetical protein BKA70DRAFT_676097 [Coprinopsis sp. MPI-PUGE-AT-0042]|nr:hypothetical protein BKA70DRAFT_676097 [Coprinopsis sp. MPI-PUGE-AT-0042]
MIDQSATRLIFEQGGHGKDILPIVFEQLYNSDCDRKSLLNAALVSRACHEPAIARLWHTLDRLEPFLHLLPLCQVEGGKYALLTRSLSGSCRERFDLHRRHVRCLRLELWRRLIQKFSLEVYTRISQLIGGEDWFPGLTLLDVLFGDQPEDTFGGVLLPFLVSPGLRTVSVGGRIVPPTPFLPLLAENAPNLGTLTLAGYSNPMMALEDPSRIELDTVMLQVAAFKSLRTLVIARSDIENENITVNAHSFRLLLKALPCLTSLVLTVTSMTNLSPTASADEWQAACSHLKTFELKYLLLHQVGEPTTLQPFPFLPYVTDIYIEFSSESPPPFLTMGSFMGLVATSTVLESVYINTSGWDEPLVGDLHDILPLFSLPSLREITMDGLSLHYTPPSEASPTYFADLIVEQLHECHHGAPVGHTCPGSALVRLYMKDVVPAPSIDSLRVIAERMPRIEVLTLAVTVPQDYSFATSNNEPPFHNSLLNLNLADDRLYSPGVVFLPQEAAALVRAIDTWFPNLAAVRGLRNPQSWGYIDQFRKDRQEQRMAKLSCPSCNTQGGGLSTSGN